MTTTFVIRRFGVLSAGLLTGLCATSVVFLILSLITVFCLVAQAAGWEGIAQLAPGILGIAGLFVIPAVYGAIGFVLGCLYALAYNVIAGLIGGLELDLRLKMAPAELPRQAE